MAYLTRWRLQLAAQALTTTPRGVADIAAEVGYESEAAFNRAFKRLFGTPPARYRREHRATDTPPPKRRCSSQGRPAHGRRSVVTTSAAVAGGRLVGRCPEMSSQRRGVVTLSAAVFDPWRTRHAYGHAQGPHWI